MFQERTRYAMDRQFSLSQRGRRAALGLLAAVLFASGAAWHGMTASNEQTVVHAATVSTPIAHSVAGGRDSYADVVDVVAPAVITVHAQGRARVSPTEFQLPDDFFGQFFGYPDQRSQRGPRQMPRAPRQNALGSGVIVTTDGYILTNN